MPSLRPRQLWGLGVLVACVGLLSVVAVAADGSPLSAPLDRGSNDWGGRFLAALDIAVLVGGVMVVAMIVIAIAGERNRRPEFGHRRALLRTLLLLAVVLFAAMAIAPFRRDTPSERTDEPAAAPTPEQ